MSPQIEQLISDSFADLNQLLDPEKKVRFSPDLVMAGPEGKLDSLALVNLTVALEDNIKKLFGQNLTLMGDPYMFDPEGPLKSVEALAAFLSQKLEQ